MASGIDHHPGRHRRSPVAGCSVLCAAVIVLGACAPSPGDTRPVVGVYGDSIAYQAAPWFDAAIHDAGAVVVGFRFPGLAACDLVRSVRADLALPVGQRPRVIVVSTVGNSLSGCMRGLDGELATVGSDGYFASYERAIREIAEAATAARVPFVFTWGPSSSPFLSNWTGRDHLGLIAARVAEDHPGMSVAHAGAVVLDDDDQFRVWLPCRSDETSTPACVDGQVRIRVSEVNAHFYCPDSEVLPGGWPRPCPVSSPGAHRYGAELARVALDRIGVGSR